MSGTLQEQNIEKRIQAYIRERYFTPSVTLQLLCSGNDEHTFFELFKKRNPNFKILTIEDLNTLSHKIYLKDRSMDETITYIDVKLKDYYNIIFNSYICYRFSIIHIMFNVTTADRFDQTIHANIPEQLIVLLYYLFDTFYEIMIDPTIPDKKKLIYNSVENFVILYSKLYIFLQKPEITLPFEFNIRNPSFLLLLDVMIYKYTDSIHKISSLIIDNYIMCVRHFFNRYISIFGTAHTLENIEKIDVGLVHLACYFLNLQNLSFILSNSGSSIHTEIIDGFNRKICIVKEHDKTIEYTLKEVEGALKDNPDVTRFRVIPVNLMDEFNPLSGNTLQYANTMVDLVTEEVNKKLPTFSELNLKGKVMIIQSLQTAFKSRKYFIEFLYILCKCLERFVIKNSKKFEEEHQDKLIFKSNFSECCYKVPDFVMTTKSEFDKKNELDKQRELQQQKKDARQALQAQEEAKELERRDKFLKDKKFKEEQQQLREQQKQEREAAAAAKRRQEQQQALQDNVADDAALPKKLTPQEIQQLTIQRNTSFHTYIGNDFPNFSALIQSRNFEEAARMLNDRIPQKLRDNVPWTAANMEKLPKKVQETYDKLLQSSAPVSDTVASPVTVPVTAVASSGAAVASSKSKSKKQQEPPPQAPPPQEPSQAPLPQEPSQAPPPQEPSQAPPPQEPSQAPLPQAPPPQEPSQAPPPQEPSQAPSQEPSQAPPPQEPSQAPLPQEPPQAPPQEPSQAPAPAPSQQEPSQAPAPAPSQQEPSQPLDEKKSPKLIRFEQYIASLCQGNGHQCFAFMFRCSLKQFFRITSVVSTLPDETLLTLMGSRVSDSASAPAPPITKYMNIQGSGHSLRALFIIALLNGLCRTENVRFSFVGRTFLQLLACHSSLPQDKCRELHIQTSTSDVDVHVIFNNDVNPELYQFFIISIFNLFLNIPPQHIHIHIGERDDASWALFKTQPDHMYISSSRGFLDTVKFSLNTAGKIVEVSDLSFKKANDFTGIFIFTKDTSPRHPPPPLLHPTLPPPPPIFVNNPAATAPLLDQIDSPVSPRRDVSDSPVARLRLLNLTCSLDDKNLFFTNPADFFSVQLKFEFPDAQSGCIECLRNFINILYLFLTNQYDFSSGTDYYFIHTSNLLKFLVRAIQMRGISLFQHLKGTPVTPTIKLLYDNIVREFNGELRSNMRMEDEIKPDIEKTGLTLLNLFFNPKRELFDHNAFTLTEQYRQTGKDLQGANERIQMYWHKLILNILTTTGNIYKFNKSYLESVLFLSYGQNNFYGGVKQQREKYNKKNRTNKKNKNKKYSRKINKLKQNRKKSIKYYKQNNRKVTKKYRHRV